MSGLAFPRPDQRPPRPVAVCADFARKADLGLIVSWSPDRACTWSRRVAAVIGLERRR